MLKLNTDEIKNLQFEVSIQGINYDELEGSLKFVIEDIEYGIPVKIQKDLVSVEVPPLEEIVAKGMKHGDIVECKLDIFGNGFYINPWGGQFELETPVKIETKNLNMYKEVKKEKKVVAELKEKTPNIEAEIVEESQSKSIDSETIIEMLFEKLAEKGFKIPDETEVPKTNYKAPKKMSKPVVESKPVKKKISRKQLVEQKIKNKFSKVDGLIKGVKKLTEGKKVIRKQRVEQPVKSEYKSQLLETYNNLQKLDQPKPAKPLAVKKPKPKEKIIKKYEDDPIALMESVGMKNPKIQKTMMDKAIELGGDGDKAVCNTLKKILGIEQVDPYAHYAKANNDK